MAKSHSRKGKPGKPTDASDDADRTVILPGADADPTLAPTSAESAATTPAGDSASAVPATAETGAGTPPARVERKELVGSLRSKEQQRARDKARGKPKAAVAAESAAGGVLEWFKSVGAAILLFFVIRTFLITAYSIPSESMEKTLLVGDYLMANNALFGATLPFTDIKLPALRDPHRGEIVVFRPTYNEPQIDVVKRVIGVPGDTLQMANGVLFRNGKRANEPYAHYDQGFDENIELEGFGLVDPNIIPERYGAKNHLPLLLPSVDKQRYRPSRNNWGPLVVPAEHYWLMGDNRDQSLDSRYMGPIPREVIRGKPLFIYYSYDKKDLGAAFPSFITAARWGRIGDRIR
ncbi:signal peptidase I [Longimicrobium sp.]|uniref:signal peptidase I n=1 Tax=Longimicrobium sp. TaxID=2029185 RepID=UPI002E326CF5|nr:signal peptidase I [Longimicrobium sp.]HEX6036469.1 signal peptidase I [Longimicrobium sp.]